MKATERTIGKAAEYIFVRKATERAIGKATERAIGKATEHAIGNAIKRAIIYAKEFRDTSQVRDPHEL